MVRTISFNIISPLFTLFNHRLKSILLILTLKGIDFQGGLLICALMLTLSYIVVYGDYLMWFDSSRIRFLTAAAIILFGIVLYRLRYYRYPYVELSLFSRKNVIPILIVTFFTELALGAEHTMEEILYCEVIPLKEATKETQFLWALPGMYAGILLDLYWLRVRKWKIWKLFGIAFTSIALYAIMMYLTLDMGVNIEQFRPAIFLRGFAYAVLSPALMWALDESVPNLEQFLWACSCSMSCICTWQERQVTASTPPYSRIL